MWQEDVVEKEQEGYGRRRREEEAQEEEEEEEENTERTGRDIRVGSIKRR